ncbi:MAG: cupredoxin domain-containing protein [Acidimicrobiales bacterium]
MGAVVSIGLAACSPTPSTLAHGPHGISQANRNAAAVITIYNTGFTPTISRVPAGLNVLVINDSGLNHSLTAFNGAFDTGLLAAGGDDASFVIAKPGTYRYYDEVNPSFQGEIVVTPAPAG